MSKRIILSLLISCLALSSTGCPQPGGDVPSGGSTSPPTTAAQPDLISLSSDYQPLVTGFDWAKRQALAYVFEGDPVGKWYEAALPGREAFCMRDVSHQALGALALGLADHTKNMMLKFAENIAESRDWCSYWEINRYDQPAPVDYRSDADFWYNLPANFDIIHACQRIFEWTGDEDYLNDTDLLNFYRRSLTDYVSAWDLNGDGLMESSEQNGYRGIPTYWEGEGPRALTGGDLIAAQYAANAAYAKMLSLRGENEGAAAHAEEARRLRRLYNDDWWDPGLGRFNTSIVADGAFDTTHIPLLQILPLYFGIVEPGERREQLVENLSEGAIVEVNAYLPEVYYQNGRNEAAFRYLMRQLDPGLPRREYPENPYTAIGTIVRHLVGIHPIASEAILETRPRLTGEVSWVRIDHVPVLQNQIAVRHRGTVETRLVNQSGPAIQWRAVLPGLHETLEVDGVAMRAATRYTDWGDPESYIVVDIDTGHERNVAAPLSSAEN